MESLLQWSLANSAPSTDGPPAAPRQPLDPGVIDAILGKSDADHMRDDLAIIMDESRDEDDRVGALDHFEMLIEQIDNANNMEKLRMWEPLQSLLTSGTSSNAILMHTIWIIGTALQNNPAAQDSYLKLNPISTLTNFLTPSVSTPKLRSRVLYALSGLLKHNAPAVKALEEVDTAGWSKLRDALQDPDITVRRKAAFLLNTLLHPPQESTTSTEGTPASLHTPDSQPIFANSHAAHLRQPERTNTSTLTLAAIQKHNIVSTVVEALTTPLPYGADGDNLDPDADFEEKCVGLLRTYVVECKASLSANEKAALKQWFVKQQEQEGGEVSFAERLGLGLSELKEFTKSVQ